MSGKKIVIYSSASGGTAVQKYTTQMNNIVRAVAGCDPKVVYLDAEPGERAMVWSKAPKGVYPVLFVDDQFIGNYDTVEGLNETEQLHAVLH
eukprot:m51a1_g8918 hypothetical protein (92) ;mRNA; f:805180-805674